VWHHEKLLNFTTSLRKQTKKTDDVEDNEEEELKSVQHNRLKVNNFIFCNVISSRFILTMQGKDRKSFEAYGYFLIELVKEQFISIDDVNELSIGLYKHEWSKVCETLFLFNYKINILKFCLTNDLSVPFSF
jgi:hypothetical protein